MTNRALDVNAENFAALVIEASREKVVIVDFWAAWCGPCKVLGPVLEQAAAKFGDRVRIAKVDVDQEPELAAHFRVQSIPTVWAFKDGQPVANFAGAQPADVVETWISRLLPSAEEETLESARQYIAEGRPAEAERILRRFLEKTPEDSAVLLMLGRLLGGGGNTAQARELLGKIPAGAAERDEADRELLLLEMIAAGERGTEAARAAVAADSGDPEARFALAGALWKAGDRGAAMDELLDLIRRDREFRQDGARRALLAAFQWLGPADPEVASRRSRLAMLLFA